MERLGALSGPSTTNEENFRKPFDLSFELDFFFNFNLPANAELGWNYYLFIINYVNRNSAETEKNT
jgi:hypothetical protein